MTTTVQIPTLETERLILRAPSLADCDVFESFLRSDRAAFVGGPSTDRRAVTRGFGHLAGLWVLRGFSLFVAEEKTNPGHAIGAMGPWYPALWPEVEFGWSLWDGNAEGKGFVTEAMRTLIPWSWDNAGIDTAVSFIDEGNDRSMAVAQRLGAVRDAAAEDAANAEGSAFFSEDGPNLTVWRHTRGALQ